LAEKGKRVKKEGRTEISNTNVYGSKSVHPSILTPAPRAGV